MPSRAIEDLDSRLQPLARALLEKCAAAGVNAFVTCTYRSSTEQAALYAQGRTAPGPKVTNAKPGTSAHNIVDEKTGKPAARAFDIAIRHRDGSLNWDARSKAWATAGAIGMSLGLDWGGSWARLPDAPHFQLRV